MKVKELARIVRKVNPEAEFQVVVLSYPQRFVLYQGGSEGCTLANCDDFGPMVDEVEHCKTTPGDTFPEGITKGAGDEASEHATEQCLTMSNAKNLVKRIISLKRPGGTGGGKKAGGQGLSAKDIKVAAEYLTSPGNIPGANGGINSLCGLLLYLLKAKEAGCNT